MKYILQILCMYFCASNHVIMINQLSSVYICRNVIFGFIFWKNIQSFEDLGDSRRMSKNLYVYKTSHRAINDQWLCAGVVVIKERVALLGVCLA